jgi:hypothetical protein
MAARLPIFPTTLFALAAIGGVTWPASAVEYPRDPQLVPASSYPRDGVAHASGSAVQGSAAPMPAVVQPAAAQVPVPPRQQPSTGNEFVAASTRMLENQVSIETKLRLEAHLFDQELVGSGTYRQGWNAARTWRLDLLMRAGEDPCLFLQVCNGQTVWIHQRAGDLQELRIIELPRARKELNVLSAEDGAPLVQWGVGGLPQLIGALGEAFDFQRPVMTDWKGTKALQLHGRWRREYLAVFLPDEKQKILSGKPFAWDKLAAHVPDEVLLYLQPSDLFPLGIEYRRTPALRFFEKLYRTPETQTLAALEFFNIRTGVTIDPNTFEWRSGNIDVIDHTPEHISDVQSLNKSVIEHRGAGQGK